MLQGTYVASFVGEHKKVSTTAACRRNRDRRRAVFHGSPSEHLRRRSDGAHCRTAPCLTGAYVRRSLAQGLACRADRPCAPLPLVVGGCCGRLTALRSSRAKVKGPSVSTTRHIQRLQTGCDIASYPMHTTISAAGFSHKTAHHPAGGVQNRPHVRLVHARTR